MLGHPSFIPNTPGGMKPRCASALSLGLLVNRSDLGRMPVDRAATQCGSMRLVLRCIIRNRGFHLLSFMLFGLCHCDLPQSSELPPPDAYSHDQALDQGHRPNPDFVPADFVAEYGANIGVIAQPLRVEGEVLVLDGGPGFLAQSGGQFGITGTNQKAIVAEVLSQYPDRFDTIAIFLSFTDANHVGTAYYQGVRNSVSGIGRAPYNGRDGWGLPRRGGRFSGFVNMNNVEMFGGLNGAGTLRSRYHAVLAQELSHRWLMFFQFKGADGMSNSSLLGRDDAHWSVLAHAYASVQDGVEWRDNGDGSFTHFGTERGFAPLDLYGLGVYGPDEVEDFFYIDDASTANGDSLNKESRIAMGTTIQGTRVTVTIKQIIDEMGPRNPPKGTETPYYRAAFVLITKPGQSQSEVQPYLDAVKSAQETFPKTWKEWSLGASALCTKVTEACPEPKLGLQAYRIEGGDEGSVGPGDGFKLALDIRNDGLGLAENVEVTVETLSPEVTLAGELATLPGITEGTYQTASPSFSVTLGSSLKCGDTVRLRVKMTSQEGPVFYDDIDLIIGYKQLKIDPLHEAVDWTVDPDSTDTAVAGIWNLGEPEFVSILGVVTQPPEDHSPGEGKFSFHTGSYKGSNFSSEDVDGGRTTLESPVFAIKEAVYPSLAYYVWHVAKDFSIFGGPEDISADLVVMASNDGGAEWVEIDRVSENTMDWTRRDIPLRPFLAPSNRMKFRFIIEDLSESGNVEAGIDDVEIVDILPACEIPSVPGDAPDQGDKPAAKTTEDQSCGCAGVATQNEKPMSLFVMGLMACFLVWRRQT